MKSAATAIAFGIALLASMAAQAQSETPPVEAPQVETPVTNEAQIPAASDAPVVEMAEFCRWRRGQQRYYPTRALSRGISGHAVLDCTLREDGTLRACQVVEEMPSGMEFGDATLRVACQFQITSDATSTNTNQIYERDGERRVRRRIDWTIER